MNRAARFTQWIVLAASLWTWGQPPEATLAEPLPTRPSLVQEAREVVTHLVGVMDTSEQAAENDNVSDVQMTTCVIQLEELAHVPFEGTTYLYQEQGVRQRLDQPYRQRFLRIAPHAPSQSVQSLAFEPAEPEAWIGFCNRPTAERVVSLADLGEPVCSVFLRPVQKGYLGRTPIDGCPTDFRGAVRITNQILLHEGGMETWDRGFDAAGHQVWGAETDAYRFRRVEPLPSGDS